MLGLVKDSDLVSTPSAHECCGTINYHSVVLISLGSCCGTA